MRAWTEEEKASLTDQLVKRGKKICEVVIEGRTYPAINNMSRRLRDQGCFNGCLPKRPLQAWSTKEIAKLKELTTEGWTARQIHNHGLLPNRTVQSISRMMNRNGLGNAERIRMAKNSPRLTAKQKSELREFLTHEGRTMVVEEVRKKFPVSPNVIRRMRKALGLSLTWEQARQTESWNRAQEKISPEFIRRTRLYWERFQNERLEAFVALTKVISRADVPPRVCRVCGTEWFATTDFYHLMRKKKNGKSLEYFSRTCRLCSNARRRAARSSVSVQAN